MSYGFSKPAPAIASSSSAPVLSRQADRPRPHTAQVNSSLRRGAITPAAPRQPRKGYLTVGLNATSLSKKPQHRASMTESRTDRITRQLSTAEDACKTAFDLFDSNGQGCISEAEMVRMMTRPSPSGTQMTAVQAKALFKNMDINASGGDDDDEGGVELREFAIRWKRDAKLLSAAAHASLAADFELVMPMLVMPYARFKEQGRIWKSTSTWRADAFRNGWLLTHEPGANGFVTVYVSHRWWHSPPGRPAGVIDWGGPDHAEGANTNLKWKMLCAAVEALIARDKLDENRVALWIDWQSIYQDDAEAKALGIASLLKIATLCRYMLVPVDSPEIAAEAQSDPLALPDYGGRAWCRLETFVFCLWAEMQPDQAPVQLYAVTSEGELHQYDAPTLTCDDSAMPSHGELTLAEDLPVIAGLEERMAESYGHEMVWRTACALRIHCSYTCPAGVLDAVWRSSTDTYCRCGALAPSMARRSTCGAGCSRRSTWQSCTRRWPQWATGRCASSPSPTTGCTTTALLTSRTSRRRAAAPASSPSCSGSLSTATASATPASWRSRRPPPRVRCRSSSSSASSSTRSAPSASTLWRKPSTRVGCLSCRRSTSTRIAFRERRTTRPTRTTAPSSRHSHSASIHCVTHCVCTASATHMHCICTHLHCRRSRRASGGRSRRV